MHPAHFFPFLLVPFIDTTPTGANPPPPHLPATRTVFLSGGQPTQWSGFPPHSHSRTFVHSCTPCSYFHPSLPIARHTKVAHVVRVPPTPPPSMLGVEDDPVHEGLLPRLCKELFELSQELMAEDPTLVMKARTTAAQGGWGACE